MTTDFQSAHDAGQASAGIKVTDIGEVPHVLVPPGCGLTALPRLMDKPKRIIASPQFNDIEGFAGYFKEFKTDGTRIFVDDTKLNFVAVFDGHSSPEEGPVADWCDHSASLSIELSHEWKRFLGYDNEAMSAKDFAEFIEDNISYITATSSTDDLSASDLLTMAQTFKIAFVGEMDTEDRLQDGLRHLIIKDESKVTGSAGGKELSFPEKITFSLRVFKNHTSFKIECWLRYRATRDKLTFLMKIPDRELTEESAFNQVILEVHKATEIKPVRGKLDGPSHKAKGY